MTIATEPPFALEPAFSMPATPENIATGLELGRCLIIENTTPGVLAELFFYNPEADLNGDLEVGWETERAAMYEQLQGAAIATAERFEAWHVQQGLVP